MNGKLKATDISTLEPSWTHPTIPGQAVQGALLFTTTDFVEPPQTSNVMKWMPMEDIIGIGNVKSEYDDTAQKITFYKTRQHLNNNNEYEYEWESFAAVQDLPEDTIKLLNDLEYVRYYFMITDNSINFTGLRKNGTMDDLGTFKVYSINEIDEKVNTINNSIQKETDDRKTADTELKTDYTNKITEETNNRKAEDTNIKNDISQKTAYAINYALGVVKQLSQEITDRKTADETLQANINNEAAARVDTDNNINTTINNNYTTLNNKIDSIAGSAVHTEVVDEKPTIPTNNTMYYIKNGEGYEIWLYTQDTWYNMGTTQIDLSSYYTKTEVDNIKTELNNKITTSSGDITTITNDLSNLTTKTTTIENKVNALDTQQTTNTQNIETNKNAIATNATVIANNKTAITNLQTQANKQKPLAGDGISVSESTNGTTIKLNGIYEEWVFTTSAGGTITRKMRYF